MPPAPENALSSINLLAGAVRALDEKVISGFSVNHEQLARALTRNPVLVTALNPVVGYEQSATIARRAWAEGRPVLDVAEARPRSPDRETGKVIVHQLGIVSTPY